MEKQQQPEFDFQHFFVDDKFYTELGDLMDDLEIDDDSIKDLPENWSHKVDLTTLAPMFELEPKRFVDDVIELLIDKHEDRSSEDGDEWDRLQKALSASIDFEKIKASIPKLYYINGKSYTITKQDLIDYCK